MSKLKKIEIDIIISRLLTTTTPTVSSNKHYMTYQDNQNRLLIFKDKDIWNMEILEDIELDRGLITLKKTPIYYILDKK